VSGRLENQLGTVELRVAAVVVKSDHHP
jgi:hypothetical protein